jgi:hypothetical protein
VSGNPFLVRLRDALEGAQVPYMVVGSFASTTYGIPRGTQDVDIVIAPSRDSLLALVRTFRAADYYADEEDALRALQSRDLFNVLDSKSGWKCDFYIAKPDPFTQAALSRRRQVTVEDVEMWVSAPEDVIIAKMQWAKIGGSDRQIEDAAGILRLRRDELELAYLERWVHDLQLEEQWQAVQQRV